MVNQTYERMKCYLKEGRMVNSEGSYEVIKRINLQNLVDDGSDLIEKLKAADFGTYAYEFCGEEPLTSLKFMADVVKEYIPNKKCTLFTSAPCKYWWKQKSGDEKSWKLFDKIIVNRLSMDDDKNNALLHAKAVKAKDYLLMNPELKQRISFFVDYKKSDLKGPDDENSIRNMLKFVKWAEKLGIKEIIFLEDEDEKKIIRQEYKEKLEKIKEEQISKLREGIGKFRLKDYCKETIQCRMPLFVTVRNKLVSQGWNFRAAKATEEGKDFFCLITVKKRNMKVVFKTKIAEDGNDFWDMARGHKYIKEL